MKAAKATCFYMAGVNSGMVVMLLALGKVPDAAMAALLAGCLLLCGYQIKP